MVRGVRGVRVVQAMQRVAANPIPAPNGQSTLRLRGVMEAYKSKGVGCNRRRRQ